MNKKTVINIIKLIVSFCVLILSSIFNEILTNYISVSPLCSIISETICLLILFLMYRKDLIKEFKIYKNNFKKCISTGIKFYLLGIGIMIFSNLIINVLIKPGISNNEEVVRNSMYAYPIYSFISIAFFAPVLEEIIFRKSLMPLVKNKWIYATISGLLFGGAHIIGATSNLLEFLYIIPYGGLGFVFAYMNYETKSTFTSITIHSLHNTVTFCLLMLIHISGVI